MPTVCRMEKKQLLSVSFVRRSYLITVGLWLLLCLLFPVWIGRSYIYDDNNEAWHSSGTFGISEGGNPLTARNLLWNPPHGAPSLSTVVRWPLAPVNAYNHVELRVSLTLWRFTLGLFFAGLAVMVIRWKKGFGTSDRVLLFASAIAVAILTAYLLIVGLGMATMGFALMDPVITCILSVAIILGFIVGRFVLRTTDRIAPPEKPTPVSDTTLPDSAATNNAKEPSPKSKLSSMQSLNWWWRVPVYLMLQLVVWSLITSQSWPVGHDVFGPYRLKPDSVVKAYWIQFAILPFLARRFQIFGMSQLGVIVLIYILPNWPQGSNAFGPFIRVPESVWPLFWIQFAATLVLFWRAPYLVKQLRKMRNRGKDGESQ